MTDRIADAAEWIAGELEGQCVHDIEHFIEAAIELGTLTEDESKAQRLLELIDDKVFCCDGCAWWTSTEELFNDGVAEGHEWCEQCFQENGGDTDD